MCMQCVGTVGTAFQAATLIGGPFALKYYQRVRAFLGLPDNSAAAVAARARALEAPPPPAPPRRGPRPRTPRGTPRRTKQDARPGSGRPAPRRSRAQGPGTRSPFGEGSTRKLNIIPLSWCSAMWQWAIQTTGVGDVEQDVHRLAGPHQHRVLPDQVRLLPPSRRRTRKRPAPWTWNGWCMGWSESISLTRRIFTRSPDPEAPVDRGVLRAAGAVDELPAHVGRGGHPVDLDHVVLPLDAPGRLVGVPVLVVVLVVGAASTSSPSGRSARRAPASCRTPGSGPAPR